MSAILCFSTGFDECCCCGGSATLGGTVEAVIGSQRSLRYCSIECHDDWENFLAEQRERVTCCPSCGYDQREHADDCSAGMVVT